MQFHRVSLLALGLIFAFEGQIPVVVAQIDCSDRIDGVYPNPSACESFYFCSNGDAYLQVCPANLHFNPVQLICDYPEDAGCVIGGNPDPTTSEPSSSTTQEPSTTTSTTQEPSTSSLEPSTTTQEPSTPTQEPSTTTQEPSTTTQEPSTTTQEPSTSSQEPSTTTQEPSTTTQPNITTTESTTQQTTSVSTEASTATSASPSPDPDNFDCSERPNGQYPNPTDCGSFYYCSNGYAYLQPCPANLHYNPVLQICDYPEDAGCVISVDPTTQTPEPSSTTLDSTSPTQEQSTTSQEQSTTSQEPSTTSQEPSTNSQEPSTTTQQPNSTTSLEPSTTTPEQSTTTQVPSTISQEPNSTTVTTTLPPVTLIPVTDGTTEITTSPTSSSSTPNATSSTPVSSEPTTPSVNSTTTPPPILIPVTNATSTTEEPSTNITTTESVSTTTEISPVPQPCIDKPCGIYPDPDRCDGFIICKNGTATLVSCPEPLLYNREALTCDLPENVSCFSCQNRSNGLHENEDDCRSFYMCSRGRAFLFECPENLIFNADELFCDNPENGQGACSNPL